MSIYIAVPKEDAYDIKHYGIMGQKWGIRRYQNKDGSLTPEGKARYGNVENFNKVMKAIKIGSAIGGPVGGVIGGAIADKKYITKSSKNMKNRSTTTGKKNVTDEEAIAAAKKAGLHQGDNYKVYRKAMSGDKEAQKIVEKWESQKKKPSIDKEVARARKTGKYDMEFLEKELDLDQRTGELLKGKALDDSYRKYLNSKQAVQDHANYDIKAVRNAPTNKERNEALSGAAREAKRTGVYATGFKDSSFYINPETGKPFTGKALDSAYKKWLIEQM